MKPILYSIAFIMCLGCATTRNTTNDLAAIDALIAAGNFEITATWAKPLVSNELYQIASSGLLPPGSQASQISLIGNSNYVRFLDGTVTGYLSYYGTQQQAKRNSNAITFNGIPENYQVITRKQNNGKQIDFDIVNDSERFAVSIVIYPNKNTRINISSSTRSAIAYTGTIQTTAP